MPEIHRDLLQCVRCDKGGDTIKKCAKCLSVSYCGRECQVADWARHKRLCLPVMIQEMGEKGRGLVASRDFKVGDLIFNDKSAVSITTSMLPHLDAQEIHAQVMKLPKKDQEAFFKLTESKSLMQTLMLAPLHLKLSAEQVKTFAIFFNNHFGDIRGNHLFLDLSLVNHCCDPNSKYLGTDDSEKIMELRAIKEIKKGEEITISYVHFSKGFLEEKELRQINLDRWNFKCTCPHCLQPEDDQFKELRKEFKELMRLMAKIEEEEKNLEAVGASFDDHFKNNPEILKENVGHLEKYLDFIIKLDNPIAFFSSWSIDFSSNLIVLSQLAGKYDLVMKGLKLLKECSERGKFTRFSNMYMEVLYSEPIQRMMDLMMIGLGRESGAGAQSRKPPSSMESLQQLSQLSYLVELRRQMQVMIMIDDDDNDDDNDDDYDDDWETRSPMRSSGL